MRFRSFALSLYAVAALALAGCATTGAQPEGTPARAVGWEAALGNGTVTSYAEIEAGGAPRAIGIAFSPGALDRLPTTGSDGHHCFDVNGDGGIDLASECLQQFEKVIPLPDVVARRSDIPFKWVLLNWNPHGHIPPGVYDLPHFDVHFFMEPIENVFALAEGPCGAELMRCDQFEIARRPLPPNHMHPDFKDVEGVVPAMGNHLIDLSGPEFNGQPFTRTWIFGVYDGRVTFYEEMVTRDYILSRPNTCFPIKAPAAVARSGFYPTVSCIRYDADSGQHTIAMERFVLRRAEPAALHNAAGETLGTSFGAAY
jgi:hypothetical protein